MYTAERQGHFQNNQRGVIALVLLSILVLALSSLMLASVSTNKIKSRKAAENGTALHQAKQALLAYSVVQAVKGSLPCPDTDTPRDGRENRAGTTCSANIGGLPYRELALDALLDTSATALWYAVAPSYSDNSVAIIRNSSLNANYTLNTTPVAAVVIAPGAALNNQQRNNLLVTNYLEGENANANIATYAQNTSETNNDLLIGLNSTAYWHLNEQAVLNQAATLLRAYRNACGEYPWAADFSPAADNSVVNLQQGNLPLSTALPSDWGSGCAAGIAPPAAMVNHWSNQIYYAFCRNTEGSCLSVVGDTPQNASAIIIAPGTVLATQDRSQYLLAEFFEDENSSGTTPFKAVNSKNISGNFNDYLHIVSP